MIYPAQEVSREEVRRLDASLRAFEEGRRVGFKEGVDATLAEERATRAETSWIALAAFASGILLGVLAVVIGLGLSS